LLFSITGFIIELVQWVSTLVSDLLRGLVECECSGEQCLLASCKWCWCSGFLHWFHSSWGVQ